jgi:hypothetical protein
MDKKKSMVKVGDLKKVVKGLEGKITEREDERTMIQKNRNIGLSPGDDKAAASRIGRLRQEKGYYNEVRERYQGIIKSAASGRDVPLPSSSQLFNKKK